MHASEGDEILSSAEVATLTALAADMGLTLPVVLESARRARALKSESTPQPPPAPSLSVRTIVTSVRQRQAVPLTVGPLTDEEFDAISPYLCCRSRTLPRREMLWRALQFAMGHANGKSAEDYSVASWLSYETSRHKGKRLRNLANAMHGVLSEQRCQELDVLADYVEQRANARQQWQ